MDLPQCWAYNSNGTRCEQRAGHASPHSYTITWTDEDCYKPGTPAHPAIEISLPPIPPPPPGEVPAAAGKCAACKHNHRGGECKCGCYEHIG